MQQLHYISVFENHLYAISWLNNSINKLNKFDATNYTTIVSSLTRPFGLHVYHRQKQPTQGKPLLNF